jgi:hypothetical protein
VILQTTPKLPFGSNLSFEQICPQFPLLNILFR